MLKFIRYSMLTNVTGGTKPRKNFRLQLPLREIIIIIISVIFIS